MDNTVGVLTLAVAALGVIFLIARYQSGQYRSYLDKQVAETAKMAESQRRTLEAVDRQTVALERIADILARDRT